jgi:hypothetical protein
VIPPDVYLSLDQWASLSGAGVNPTKLMEAMPVYYAVSLLICGGALWAGSEAIRNCVGLQSPSLNLNAPREGFDTLVVVEEAFMPFSISGRKKCRQPRPERVLPDELPPLKAISIGLLLFHRCPIIPASNRR